MLRDELARRAIESIATETDAWCRKAIDHGPEWRVWRSDARNERGQNLEYLVVHDFQLLPPGASPPGSGLVFGPWPHLQT